MSIVAIWAGQTAQSDARAFLDGRITNEQFVERAAPYLLMSVVQAVATGAAAVVTMIWMFRIARNHRTLHRGGTWGPGWAIGGWFLPPLLFVIPFLMFRELWKASDPETAVGDNWRMNPTSWLIPVWFVFYSLLPLGLLVAQTSNGFSLGTSERDMAQQVIDNQGLTIAVVSYEDRLFFGITSDRDVIADLVRDFRCVTLDAPGTGLSSGTGRVDLTMSSEAIDALVRHLDLRDIVLVLHDLGGIATLHKPLAAEVKIQVIMWQQHSG